MNDNKAWRIGFILIVVFVLLSQGVVVFHNYVFARLGFSRDLVLLILWFLPVIASFITVTYSNNKRILKGFSLVVVLTILGPLAHLLSGYLGAKIDMPGISGLRVTILIDLWLGMFTVGLGILVSLLVRACLPTSKKTRNTGLTGLHDGEVQITEVEAREWIDGNYAKCSFCGCVPHEKFISHGSNLICKACIDSFYDTIHGKQINDRTGVAPTDERLLALRVLEARARGANRSFTTVVQIGKPYWVEEGTEAACPLTLDGLYDRQPDIRGIDPFDALSNAVLFADRLLTEAVDKYDFYWPNGEPFKPIQ
jgi:hypothetical protein